MPNWILVTLELATLAHWQHSQPFGGIFIADSSAFAPQHALTRETDTVALPTLRISTLPTTFEPTAGRHSQSRRGNHKPCRKQADRHAERLHFAPDLSLMSFTAASFASANTTEKYIARSNQSKPSPTTCIHKANL